MNKTATCCCKQASITVSGNPEIHAVCHCDNCKQRTGSAFGISAYFKKEYVISKTGVMTTYSFHHQGLNHDQKRFFCSECGTTLYWEVTSMPNMVGVAGGCFTGKLLSEPLQSASHSNKCEWINLPEQWITNG